MPRSPSWPSAARSPSRDRARSPRAGGKVRSQDWTPLRRPTAAESPRAESPSSDGAEGRGRVHPRRRATRGRRRASTATRRPARRPSRHARARSASAGAALRRVQGRREALPAAGRAGHGHLRQGRHHAPRRGPDGPAGREATPPSRRPPPRSASTPSCGGSATPCRAPARSGCSTGRSTRTSSSSGCTTWCRGRRGRGATPRSTTSRRRPSPTGTTIVKVMLQHLRRTSRRPGSRERLERAGQALEVQPRRRRRAAAVAASTRRPTRPCSRRLLDRRRALVRRARRPQVVRPAGRPEPACSSTCEPMDPQWPAADFDVEAEKERLART